MKGGKLLLAVVMVGALAGCATVDATMYPMNADAQKYGLLHATVHENLMTGAGTITCKLPNGEVLKGQYTTMDSGSASFGTGFGSVETPRGSATGSVFESMQTVPGTQAGFAVLTGNNGTTADCKYYVNTQEGNGTGICKMSDGAIFRMMF